MAAFRNLGRAFLKTERAYEDAADAPGVSDLVGECRGLRLVDTTLGMSPALHDHDPAIALSYALGVDLPNCAAELAGDMLLTFHTIKTELFGELVEQPCRYLFVGLPVNGF